MGLLDFFSSKPKPVTPPQPGGLLGQIPAGQNYRQYQEEQMMKGQTPLSLADWQKQQAAAQQPPKK